MIYVEVLFNYSFFPDWPVDGFFLIKQSKYDEK